MLTCEGDETSFGSVRFGSVQFPSRIIKSLSEIKHIIACKAKQSKAKGRGRAYTMYVCTLMHGGTPPRHRQRAYNYDFHLDNGVQLYSVCTSTGTLCIS